MGHNLISAIISAVHNCSRLLWVDFDFFNLIKEIGLLLVVPNMADYDPDPDPDPDSDSDYDSDFDFTEIENLVRQGRERLEPERLAEIEQRNKNCFYVGFVRVPFLIIRAASAA